jgi:hypothetical protein
LSQAIHQVEARVTQLSARREPGSRVADLLRGAWRQSPPATSVDLSEVQLNDILPLLLESGAAALAWWQLRATPLAETVAGRELHDAYRRFRLSARVHERELAHVFALLRAQGIEPVLVKGWASARLYPDAALRPYGDLDLCVAPREFVRARATLKCLADLPGYFVDLHSGFSRIGQTKEQEGYRTFRRLRRVLNRRDDTRFWEQLFSRSQLVSLTSAPEALATAPQFQDSIRVLCPEDHLRLLSAHLLRSGARRAAWLCVLAVRLVSRRRDFNWDIAFAETQAQTRNWLATTIALAEDLLGADCGERPEFARVGSLPRWLAPAVVAEWGKVSEVGRQMSDVRFQMSDLGASLAGLPARSRYARWHNPIRATAAVGGQFNDWPRLPYQLGELFLRLPELPKQLHALWQQRHYLNGNARDRGEPVLGPACAEGTVAGLQSSIF